MERVLLTEEILDETIDVADDDEYDDDAIMALQLED